MKLQKIESRNAWDGFDGTDYEYDEKAEKKYDGAIWKYLLGAAIFMLFLTSMSLVKEQNIIRKGTSIICDYYVEADGDEIARYYDVDNILYTFNVTSMNTVHTQDSITMYYLSDLNSAIPQTSIMNWLFYYSFFGALGAVSIWRIRKNKY